MQDADTPAGQVKLAEHLQSLATKLQEKIKADDNRPSPVLVVQSAASARDAAILFGAPQRPLEPAAEVELRSLERLLKAQAPERIVLIPDRWFAPELRDSTKRVLSGISGQSLLLVQTCDVDLCEELILDAGPALLRQRIVAVAPDSLKSTVNQARLLRWLPDELTHPDFQARTSTGGTGAPFQFYHGSVDALGAELAPALGASEGILQLFIRDPGSSPIDSLITQSFEQQLGAGAVSTEIWEDISGLSRSCPHQ